jgi:hypothetical protein
LPERENALLQSSTDVHHHERDNTERRADPERNGLLRQVGELDPLRSVASATSGIRGVNRPHHPLQVARIRRGSSSLHPLTKKNPRLAGSFRLSREQIGISLSVQTVEADPQTSREEAQRRSRETDFKPIRARHAHCLALREMTEVTALTGQDVV